MLAIETRFIGPTNLKGSRISARVMETARPCEPTRRLIVECQDQLGIEANHRAAAKQLIARLGWDQPNGYGEWVVGATDTGYVFVCDTRHGQDRLEPAAGGVR